MVRHASVVEFSSLSEVVFVPYICPFFFETLSCAPVALFTAARREATAAVGRRGRHNILARGIRSASTSRKHGYKRLERPLAAKGVEASLVTIACGFGVTASL